MKQYHNTIHYKFLILILCTLPFINTSFIIGSKISITLFILILYMFIMIKNLKYIKIETDDTLLILFLFFMYMSQVINYKFSLEIRAITQLINLLIVIISYISFKYLIKNTKLTIESILNLFFKYSSYIIIITLVFYVIGLVNNNLIFKITHAINNSGSFSVGGIITSFEFGLPRLNTIMPEPSFISFFIAINIAIGLSLKDNNKILLFINILALILTIGRTGYLIFLIVVIYTIFTKNKYMKIYSFLISILLFFCTIYILNTNMLLNIDDSFRQRFESLFIVTNFIKDNFIFGIGLNGFYNYAENNNLDFHDIYSLYLYLFAGGGFIPFFIFISFLLYNYIYTDRKYRKIVIAIIIGWATLSAYNMLYIWFLLALLRTKNE
jgi:hypothetical protein